MVHLLLTETSPSLPSREGGREGGSGWKEGREGGREGGEGRRGRGMNAPNLIHRHVVV